MSDLREKLAEQIYCAYYSTRPRPPLMQDIAMAAHKTFDPTNPSDAAWLAAADECIRQMKWTYHANRWSNPETMPWYQTILEDGDMTTGLAPDDWRPE